VERRRLGTSDLLVSELTLGAMTFGRETGPSESLGVVAAYVEAGGNLLDTADCYNDGRSEEICGRALAACGGELMVATKTGLPWPDADAGGYAPARIRRSLEGSLRRLDVDHVDLYQLHVWDPLTPLEDALETLAGLVAAGTIRAFGISNFPAWAAGRAHGLLRDHDRAGFAAVQYHYSLACRDAELEILPFCIDCDVAMLPWSPLSGGVLTGKYGAGAAGRASGPPEWRGYALQRALGGSQEVVNVLRAVAGRLGAEPGAVALRWLLDRPGVASAIAGCRTVEQWAAAAAASEVRLPAGERERLDRSGAPEPRYPQDFIDLVLPSPR
jgi:aryl-alcohol dehydrogenase-like predicted oxidoreductase